MATGQDGNQSKAASTVGMTRYNLDIDPETGLRIRVGETDVSDYDYQALTTLLSRRSSIRQIRLITSHFTPTIVHT